MVWYPDWVIALDDVAKGVPGATITQRNAQDIIAALKQGRRNTITARAELAEERTDRHRVR